MANSDQLHTSQRGGGRYVMSKRFTLSLASGHVGVTGTGSITGGSGGTNGTYPLVLTGGTVGAGPVSGVVTVAAGAVSSISITTPGDYTTAPTAASFANVPGLTGASVASITTVACSTDTWSPPLNTRVRGIRVFTDTAFTGSPTNINLRLGNAFNDASYVANTDVKGQGVVDLTLVGAGLATICADGWSGPLVATLLNNAGTNPVGTVYVEADFYSINPWS